MEIGFIGLGRMGIGMAANLLKAGTALAVYNRTQSKAATLVDQGATLATNVAAACNGNIVISMLSDDRAMEDLAFGPDGIIASLPEGAIHVCSSTISIALSERLTSAHATAGQHFIAAPVFGRPDAAAAAKLFFVAAGQASALDTVVPLFDLMGQRTFRVSETPKGANLVKLAGNFLIATVIESLGESMALVGKAGVDPGQFLEVLTSTLFSAPVYKNYGSMIVNGRYSPAGFAAPLGQKDVRLTLEAAESLKVPLPIASLLRDRFLTLMAQGGEELDWAAIAKLAAQDAAIG